MKYAGTVITARLTGRSRASSATAFNRRKMAADTSTGDRHTPSTTTPSRPSAPARTSGPIPSMPCPPSGITSLSETRRPISRLIDPTVRAPSITRRRHASSPTIAVPSLA